MQIYNTGGIWDGLKEKHNNIVSFGEEVQDTADNPLKDPSDLSQDIRDFTEMVRDEQLGKRVILASMGGAHKVSESIVQEIK